MTECSDCKWIACRHVDPIVSGQPDVYVCRLDGFRVFLQLAACDRFEAQEPGRPMKAWDGPVKERKGDENA